MQPLLYSTIMTLTKHTILLALLILLLGSAANAQNRNSVWAFGDSALVDFSDPANPALGTSAVKSRGSCASVSDSKGNLLFYASTWTGGGAGNKGLVYNRLHQLMANGSGLVAQNWYSEMTIVSDPGDTGRFYIFSVGVTNSSQKGVYYSVVNMHQNNGLGVVVTKNVPLATVHMADCISAIKHANGRDWWVLARPWDSPNLSPVKTFYKWLVTDQGVSGISTQDIGVPTISGFVRFKFSPDGSKLAMTHAYGSLQLFDFDRCSGLLSNPVLIDPDLMSVFVYYWTACFSASGRFLYAVHLSENQAADTLINIIYQFDLQAPNIAASRYVVALEKKVKFVLGETQFYGGLARAPDDKIYMASGEDWGSSDPYPDTLYTARNTHLSVINNPEGAGTACNYTPFSFYLGGKRTYWGLPNNPDYELGPLVAQVANAGPGGTICRGNSLKLGIAQHNACTYSWQPATDLSDATEAQPTATPGQSQWYYLTVTDTTKSAGCNETRDSVWVEVTECDTALFIPNIITPNNDNKNDHFVIRNLPTHSALTIFNRWGHRVFSSSSYTHDWPIEEVDAGIYFYVLRIPASQATHRGTVTVVRE